MLLSEAAEDFLLFMFSNAGGRCRDTAEAEVEKAAQAGEKDKCYKTQPEGYLRLEAFVS